MTDDLKFKLAKVRMLVMDVDGTLTDSAMYYSANGEELKRFSTRDGMGITLLHQGGVITAILTSENSAIAVARAEKLKIKEIVIGCHNKKAALYDFKNKYKLDFENIAYIGDDVNDLEAIETAGCTASPMDAAALVKEKVDHICNCSGGNGAVREFAEMILQSQDKLLTLLENW